ncbi:MAG: TetR family transcriptional regulator [Ilumatobacteraceae bacterium]
MAVAPPPAPSSSSLADRGIPSGPDTELPGDPLRERLLEAAAQVFATKGYDGARIVDVVRAAGLSIGAAYGRFESKDELLLAAVIAAVERQASEHLKTDKAVADMLAEAGRATEPLDDQEAIQLEAYVAARRKPTLAAAISEARQRWRTTRDASFIEMAKGDGSASPDADFDSLVYLVQTLHLGLLVQRAAGQHPPDDAHWQRFVAHLLRTMAHPEPTV